MTYEADRQTITSHLKTELAQISSLPVKTDNLPFDPPGEGAWVELHILRGQAQAASLRTGAGARVRYTGLVQFDVVVEPGTGSREALEACDHLATIFAGKKVGAILFRQPDGPIPNNEPETSRQRFIMRIPYQRDAIT